VLAAIGAALVPGLTCPACWPGYAALLSALGLRFIPTTPYLLPLTVGVLVVALVALAFRAETRTPIALGVAASVIVVVGKFVFASNPVTYTGAGLLVAASLSITRTRHAAPCSACAPEKSSSSSSLLHLPSLDGISLCPACDTCPSVEVEEHEVRIGEAGNR
jgi:mercuric ion transport protein